MPRFASVAVTFAIAIWSCATARGEAPPASVLENPALTKKTIAAAAGCSWKKEGGGQTCRGDVLINLTYASTGDLEDIEFLALRAENIIDGPRFTGQAKKEKAILIKTIAALFPSWKNSHTWLGSAFDKSLEREFHASIRIDEVSVYAREFHYYMGRDENPHFYVVLTAKKDLREYKDRPCADDGQGPGLDDCTEGRLSGYPPPPVNSILLLK